MAKQTFTDAGIYFAGYDLSGFLNSCALELGADAVEQTAFGDAAHNFLPGLKRAAFSAAGFFSAANPDAPLAGNVGTGADRLIVAAEAAVAAPAWMLKALISEYTPLTGAVGEMAGMSLGVGAEDQAIRGQLEALETLAASGASTGVQLGALTSAQRIWAAAMTAGAVGGSSPTLDLKLQSDDNADFTSATDRIAFSQMTGRAQEMLSLDGAVADDYWRFAWTLGGSTPTFPIVCAFGIVTI